MKLNFNLTAMSAPSTEREFSDLLDECLHMLDVLTEMSIASTKLMEQALVDEGA